MIWWSTLSYLMTTCNFGPILNCYPRKLTARYVVPIISKLHDLFQWSKQQSTDEGPLYEISADMLVEEVTARIGKPHGSWGNITW